VKLLEHVWNALPGEVDVAVPGTCPSSAARRSEPKRR
jgi:hypothetical protein